MIACAHILDCTKKLHKKFITVSIKVSHYLAILVEVLVVELQLLCQHSFLIRASQLIYNLAISSILTILVTYDQMVNVHIKSKFYPL